MSVGVRGGPLPDRAGRYPDDGVCHGCQFRDTCWADWTPPAVEDVFGLEQDVQTLADAEDSLHVAKLAVDAATRRRNDLRDALRPYVTPDAPLRAGGVVVKVTPIRPSESFSLTDARKAGHDLPDELAAFVKPRAGGERWDVKRIEAAS